METQDITPSNDYDYVPPSVKVIIYWFYLLGALSFVNFIYVDPKGTAVLNGGGIINGCLLFISAFGLGYKKNSARVMAIVLAGIWLMPIICMSLVFIINHLIYIGKIAIQINGEAYTADKAIIVVAFLIFTSLMQIYVIRTLLQPKIKELFIKK